MQVLFISLRQTQNDMNCLFQTVLNTSHKTLCQAELEFQMLDFYAMIMDTLATIKTECHYIILYKE